MDVLELDGAQYVKAATAAKAAGYTADYVGQLCRSGAIKAHLVGRSWYVDASQLREHKSTKKRSQRVKAREQIQKIRAEAESVGNTSHFAQRAEAHSFTYEPDESELIPAVKRVVVESELPKSVSQKPVAPKREPAYEVEQPGEKIVMSGSISVVDATDEFLMDPSATVLHPKIEVRKPVQSSDTKESPQKKVVTSKSTQVSVRQTGTPEGSQSHVSITKNNSVNSSDFGKHDTVRNQEPSTFLEKLAAADAHDELAIQDLNELSVDATTANTASATSIDASKQYSTLPITSIGLTIAVTCVLLVLLLEGQWTYHAAKPGSNPEPSVTESRYMLDHTDLFAKISF